MRARNLGFRGPPGARIKCVGRHTTEPFGRIIVPPSVSDLTINVDGIRPLAFVFSARSAATTEIATGIGSWEASIATPVQFLDMIA